MKKTTFTSVLGLAALIFGLNTHAAVNTNFNGVSLGGALGGLSSSAEIENDLEAHEHESKYTIEKFFVENNKADDQSSLWAVHLGYGGAVWDWPLWLGVELFVNNGRKELLSTTDFDELGPPSIETEVSLKRTEYGFDFRPGVLATTTTLLYARVGAAFNTLEIASDDILGSTKKVMALRLGAGIEQKMSCNLSFALDYVYTDYGKIAASRGESFFTDYGVYESYSVDIQWSNEADNVRTHAIMLGLTYYPMVKDCQ